MPCMQLTKDRKFYRMGEARCTENSRFDAIHRLYRSTGVSKSYVFLGHSFGCLAIGRGGSCLYIEALLIDSRLADQVSIARGKGPAQRTISSVES